MNYRTSKPQDYNDMGGKHQAVYAGKCAVCGSRVYNERDYNSDGTLTEPYNPDWRGVIPVNHCADTLVASEHGYSGNDVQLCAVCANDEPRYTRGLNRAKTTWKKAD